MSIMTIDASIFFMERAKHLDIDAIKALKAAPQRWFGRKDIAGLRVGQVTIWIDATADGRTNIGIYRQFLNRKQRAELNRQSSEIIELAKTHGLEDLILAANGSLPQIDKR